MDYFKSLSSVASAVLASKGGPLPNFTIGEKVSSFEGKTIWSLHQGTKRDDSTPASILVFDTQSQSGNRSLSTLPLAKNALRRLRTLRHPDVLKLLDSAETSTAVYIAVEPVRPLGKALEEFDGNGREEWVGWGLSRVMNAIKFINVDANMTHGNIRVDSIFLSQSGEWRLGGFDVLSSNKDDSSVLYNLGGLLPEAQRYTSPEVKQGGWQVLKGMDHHVVDSYATGLLILESFNGILPPQSGTSVPPQGKCPATLYALVKRMMVPNAKNRLPTDQVLQSGDAEGGFFAENKLVKVGKGMDNFMLSSDNERNNSTKLLKENLKSFPAEFLQHKVIPILIQALNFVPNPQSLSSPTIQAPKILPLVLQLGSNLNDNDFKSSLTPAIIKAFGSADRIMRMALLDHLELYASRLENRTITDKIWPHLITGFVDSAIQIREATVKAILPLAPKLSDRILNNDLLRQLAKTQVDPEPGIRTNTTILLGRLSPQLSLNTRKKVLIPAFGRSLKDPFVHARVAGIMALMATGDSYDKDDAAKQVLPAVVPSLVDGEKLVRDQASKAVVMFMKKVEEGVKDMPDSLLPPEGQSLGAVGGHPSAPPISNGEAGIVSSAGGAASALAGWAMSSAMSQLSKSSNIAELQHTSLDGRTTPGGGTVANPHSSDPSSTAASPNRSHSSSSLRASSPLTKPTSSTVDSAAVASDWSQGGDLMDVMDDSEDWTGFSAAPVAITASGRGIGSMRRGSARGTGSVRGRGANRAPSLGANRIYSSSSSSHSSPAVPTTSTLSSSLVPEAQSAVEEENDAWGDEWGVGKTEERSNDQYKSASTAAALDAVSNSSSSRPSRASSPNANSSSTAAAFSSVPGWGTPTSTFASLPAKGDDWGNFDEEETGSGAGTPSSDISAKPLTREEKKAELERKREERKARMALLKEQKSKLGAERMS